MTVAELRKWLNFCGAKKNVWLQIGTDVKELQLVRIPKGGRLDFVLLSSNPPVGEEEVESCGYDELSDNIKS